MRTAQTLAELQSAFLSYHASLLNRIDNAGGGGGDSSPPGSLGPGATVLSRLSPLKEYLGNFSDNATIQLGTNFQVNDAIKISAYVASGKLLTINSTQVIEVIGGVPGNSHSLAGKITKTIILQKTSAGWNLYI